MKKRRTGKNFYVVIRGRFCGVFDDWLQCKSQVQCYEKNKYQGFYTLQDAMQFIRTHLQEMEPESGYICELNESEQYFGDAMELLQFMEKIV